MTYIYFRNGEGIRKTVQVISAILVDPEPLGEKWVKFEHFKVNYFCYFFIHLIAF